MTGTPCSNPIQLTPVPQLPGTMRPRAGARVLQLRRLHGAGCERTRTPLPTRAHAAQAAPATTAAALAAPAAPAPEATALAAAPQLP